MKIDTKLIHSGYEYDKMTGALGVPIYQTSTFAQFNLEAKQEFDYARCGTPTRKALEDTIAFLEGGKAGFAFSSGMSAIASVLGIFENGDHIVAAEDVYGGTYRILTTFYKRWGLLHTSIDASNIENIKAAITNKTKALFLETPSNPLLKITDLKAASALARELGIITIVDNTFMSPALQRPIELGADIVVHSGTKFLGGHSDVISGLAVARTAELGRRIYHVQNSFGAVLGPWDIFLMLRGIKTLKVRLDAASKTALKIAEWLNSNKKVEAVYYPALPGHNGAALHASQAEGAGAVLSFKTKNAEAAKRFLAKVKLAAPAVSLGGVETIVSYPVMMSHSSIPREERERLGITENLLRISCGLEAADDLIADFDNALE